MSISPENTPHLPARRQRAFDLADRKLGLLGLLGKKETNWEKALYNFGLRFGLERLRGRTDETIGHETLGMIMALTRRAPSLPTITEYRRGDKLEAYRHTHRPQLKPDKRTIEVDGTTIKDIEVTSLSFYKDYIPGKDGKRHENDYQNRYGINFDVSIQGRSLGFEIGNRYPSATGYCYSYPEAPETRPYPDIVPADPERRPYPDIFPLSQRGISNRLAELYPPSPTAKRDMVLDVSRGSIQELMLTLIAREIVEQFYDIKISNIPEYMDLRQYSLSYGIEELLNLWRSKAEQAQKI